LAEAHATAGFRRLATSVGGEDVFVALSEQEDEPMDYEKLTATSEAFIYVAMTRVMVRRLARTR
jgi:transposase